MDKIRVGRGYIYSIIYHVAWYAIDGVYIIEQIGEKYFEEMFHIIAKDNNFEIKKMRLSKESIYLVIECKPQNYIPNMIKALKGGSAKKVIAENPSILEECGNTHLWEVEYFVSTSYNVDDEKIKHQVALFFERQKEKIKRKRKKK